MSFSKSVLLRWNFLVIISSFVIRQKLICEAKCCTGSCLYICTAAKNLLQPWLHKIHFALQQKDFILVHYRLYCIWNIQC